MKKKKKRYCFNNGWSLVGHFLSWFNEKKLMGSLRLAKEVFSGMLYALVL